MTANRATAGGGVANAGGTVLLRDSNVTGNHAPFYGGGGIQNGGIRNAARRVRHRPPTAAARDRPARGQRRPDADPGPADGSPAIDHGGARATGCPAADQRGVSRPQGPACDIGAVEVQVHG